MSVIFKKGNLFEDDATILINTVNCVGIMGKGVALQAKTLFPAMYQKYRTDCNAGLYKPGCVKYDRLPNGRYIGNAATKNHWKDPSKMEWVQNIVGLLKWLSHQDFIASGNEATVALPPLGCGNGGLKWPEVRALIEAELSDHPVEFRVYEP